MDREYMIPAEYAQGISQNILFIKNECLNDVLKQCHDKIVEAAREKKTFASIILSKDVFCNNIKCGENYSPEFLGELFDYYGYDFCNFNISKKLNVHFCLKWEEIFYG